MTPQVFALSLMLARVCVSEAGWNGHEECTVIVHALVQQAHNRGIPLEQQICAYAPNSCDRDRQDGRRWISHLHPNRTSAPPGWPRMSWAEYRAKFTGIMMLAYRSYMGEVPSACPQAYHWGSVYCEACRVRMRDSGFVRAGCGLRNAWYRRAE
jgi:hypothetical protein